jgi:hypothetical protein
MSPESFSRAIGALGDSGAITVDGRTVKVRDATALARAAHRQAPVPPRAERWAERDGGT